MSTLPKVSSRFSNNTVRNVFRSLMSSTLLPPRHMLIPITLEPVLHLQRLLDRLTRVAHQPYNHDRPYYRFRLHCYPTIRLIEGQRQAPQSDPKAPPLTQSPSHRRMELTKLTQSEFNAPLPP
ncbi:hypothetical protein D9613_011918 [Agrocybe pediades]|uniref:Uncharacterized protein n=1 Tax=Agrocybe pediades TaxID=84607 RepID=A0A8H4QFK2_9AGAR|nr:hypothetical protein D9613_011918 [Agrocybe pediades]